MKARILTADKPAGRGEYIYTRTRALGIDNKVVWQVDVFTFAT